jgi:hypothetical protein
MLHTTIKGMLSHKTRSLLTAISIALGVAFLAGHADADRQHEPCVRQPLRDGQLRYGRRGPGRSDTDRDGTETGRAPVPAGVLDEVRGAKGSQSPRARSRGTHY